MRPADEKVVVAYIRPSMVHGKFAESLIDLIDFDNANNRRLFTPGGQLTRLSFESGSNLSQARNKVCEQFLAYGQAEWLFMVDTDMVFKPDVIERLLEYADPQKAPVVGGLCFGFSDSGAVLPTLYDMADLEGTGEVSFVRYHDWKPDAMMPVVGTGAAAMLVHRSVLEAVREAKYNPVFPWFQETYLQDKAIGEDITFCLRAGQCGFPIYVNTAVHIGHIKERVLSVEGYLAGRGLLSFAHKGVAA